MNFFQIEAAYSTKSRKRVHKALVYEINDLQGVVNWENDLDDETEPSEALRAPKMFNSLWWNMEKPVDPRLADYPPTTYSRPVCSRQMWDVIVPFSVPGMAWLQLPQSADGIECEWGVIFGVPSVAPDLDKESSDLPDFFQAETADGDQCFFVSERLKKAFEESALIGISYIDAA